ncbi:MAG: SpoIID/LytB domain-containing protein [Lachnospiraceae bacterium]|nr:SpoIID/LytB domain-containing protein [Lachnospiraceae bacterium]
MANRKKKRKIPNNIKLAALFLIVSWIMCFCIYEGYYIKQFKKIDLTFDIWKSVKKNKDKKFTETDNREIGIVITNKGVKYFNTITFKSNGVIKVSNKNNLSHTYTLNIDNMENDKQIEIRCDKKMKLDNISDYCYSGYFVAQKTSLGIVLVNRVNIEDYIEGVVASEMPSSFEKEALKAQAICARTFTYKHLKNNKYKKYKAIMDDTTAYQVYGVTNPCSAIIDSVKETEKIVITSDDKLINAYYFSTSCGMTTNYKIWNSKMNYLKSVSVAKEDFTAKADTGDFYNSFLKTDDIKAYEKDCPYFRWKVTIPKQAIENKIYEIEGVLVGNIKKIDIEKRDEGGSASKIKIKGSIKDTVIEGQMNIRKIFCPYGNELELHDGSVRNEMNMLPSSFIVIEQKEDCVTIFGGGYGHGSGMSQYGANELAKSGKNAEDIIRYFYSGVDCESRYIN